MGQYPFKISDFKLQKKTDSVTGEIIDYGVKMVGAPLEWGETKGESIKVGIIDTGVDCKHPDLKNRIVKTRNFVDPDPESMCDENGHGTHVAGIVAASLNNFGVVGVAPACDLYIAKAFLPDGNADSDAIRNALIWLTEEQVHVINMSFASKEYDPSYHEQIKEAYQAGITLVCAAGNSGALPGDTIGFPAKFEECISVTAVDVTKQHAKYSSRGQRADIAAAGTNILSCYPGGKFARLSGTSMATPIISGAAALLHKKAYNRMQRCLTPEEMRLVLSIYTEDLGGFGRDVEYGNGLFSFGRLNKMSENIKRIL